MKKITILILALLSIHVHGQSNLSKKEKQIVEEGKLLYRSEMASWYGTDLFLEKYTNSKNIEGYFSYLDKDTAKCVFFSKADIHKVIGTITFDSTYHIKAAKLDLTERDFTSFEADLYAIRKTALSIINSDTLFKSYKNANLNLIPLINGREKKVFVLTGPKESGVVIFGNDYLLNFNDKNELISRKKIHASIIPINYNNKVESDTVVTIHTHLPETGDFITSTDICTLMLYEKFAKWKQHDVVSKKYLSMWDCSTDKLTIIPMKVIRKIDKDVQKPHKQGDQ